MGERCYVGPYCHNDAVAWFSLQCVRGSCVKGVMLGLTVTMML